jgi:hypothetical protein
MTIEYMNSISKKCEALARELMLLWVANPKQPYYDEHIGECHNHPTENTFELSTNLVDSTTYYLVLESYQFLVNVKRLKNYKAHNSPFLDATMDKQDWQDMHAILLRLVHMLKSFEVLKTLDLNAAWKVLQEALFSNSTLGLAPEKMPTIARNPDQLANTLKTTLKKTKRFADFEWRDWHYDGVEQIQKMAPLKGLSIKFAKPTEDELRAISESDEFSLAVLNWFDAQLSPHGLTLIAISPMDEYQAFGLVSNQNLTALSAALKTLCIYCESAPRYTNDN